MRASKPPPPGEVKLEWRCSADVSRAFVARDRPAVYLSRMSSRDRACAIAAGLLPLVVYLRTLAPTVYGLDSAELTTAAYVLGIPHAPGAPLFVILGHLLTWLPVGDVGYRVNLLSALAAAAALPFLYAVHRRLGAGPLLALGTCWFLGFTYYYWVTAVAAELYALQSLVLSVLLWMAVCWREQIDLRRVCLFAAAAGLGSGAHLSLILVLPGLAYLLLGNTDRRFWLRPTWIAAVAACGLLGAAIHLYLPLRQDAPVNFARSFGVDLRTWEGFWWMLGGGSFADRYLAVPVYRWPGQLMSYLVSLWSNFLGLGLLLGAVGVAAEIGRDRRVHLALLAMFGAHLAFFLTYSVTDRQVMMVPTYLIWSVWIGLGAAAVAGYVRSAGPGDSRGAGVGVLALALVALVFNWRFVDLSEDWSARDQAEAVVASLPIDAVYLATWREVPVIEYLQLVEGERPDIDAYDQFFVPTARRRDLIAESLRGGRRVFVSSRALIPRVGANTRFDEICSCYEILDW